METRSGSNLRPIEDTFEDEDSDTSVQVLTEEGKAQQQRQAAKRMAGRLS